MKSIFIWLFLFAVSSCQQSPKEPANLVGKSLNEVEFFIQSDQWSAAREKMQQVQHLIQTHVKARSDIESTLLLSRAALFSFQIADSALVNFGRLGFSSENYRPNETHLIICLWQNRLKSMLENGETTNLDQQCTIHHTLASLYCLLPDSAPLAEAEFEKAIFLTQSQLNQLFEGRNRFDPKVFPIFLLKRKLKSLQVLRAEANLKVGQWQKALQCLDSYASWNDEDISVRIELLERRKVQIAPFIHETFSGKNVYDLERRRVETELAELKKIIAYKTLCIQKLMIEDTAQSR